MRNLLQSGLFAFLILPLSGLSSAWGESETVEAVHLRHLVVGTDREAQDLIAQIRAGADFKALAREKSLAPSGKAAGGDYGFVSRGMLPPHLEQAAFSMKQGELRAITDSRGVHVLQIVGLRLKTPDAAPAMEKTKTSGLDEEKVQRMMETAIRKAAQAQKHPEPVVIQSDVDKPGYKTPENPNNYAVVIAAEKYASLPAADFAERDADAVRAHLIALGYPARNIYFLTAQQATRAKIAQSVNTWLPNRVGENSTVFFHYSGHGAPNPQTNQAYLVPVDGDPEDLESTAYPISLLYSKLNSLKAREVIVALDSCFSGAGGRSVLAKGTRPLVAKVTMGVVPIKIIALMASDTNQVSGTMEEQGHGTFTYYMLKGLGGAAKNSSGRVTVQSLYDYLTPKVQDASRLHNRSQTPQLISGSSAGAGTGLR